MNESKTAAQPFRVRNATPADIPVLMRLKRLLAEGEDALHAVRAGAGDWLRDGFGPGAGFCAFVAEVDGAVVAMATCSQRVITGWNGPVIFLQDLFVEPAHRRRGIARALTARVAALACDLGSPIVELTVRSDNPAQAFYNNNGFTPLPQCLTYVLSGPQLRALAGRDKSENDNTKQAPTRRRLSPFNIAPFNIAPSARARANTDQTCCQSNPS
jgi:ribosomal protein S18 acetylase RimI-like enzyme